jgi:hypothetical protein
MSEELNIQKEKALELSIVLFKDGSISVNPSEEFIESNIGIVDIEFLLRDALDRIYTNRIASSVINILNKQNEE